VGLQTLENKVLSWGITGKSASVLAEITIRKSQAVISGSKKQPVCSRLGCALRIMLRAEIGYHL
jgi:hypothetical protein